LLGVRNEGAEVMTAAKQPIRFKADVPPESGWYFATNDIEDPTNEVLGYYEAGRKLFSTFSPEFLVIGMEGLRGVSIWGRGDTRWFDTEMDGGSWSGPDEWYGPIETPWAQFEGSAR
jgi:hypothetical protein